MTGEKWSPLPSLIAYELQELDAEIAALYGKRHTLIQDTVAGCKHPLDGIYELPYSSGSFNIESPWLICSKCGYTEQGWGCGYKKLRHAEYAGVPKISREAWNKLATMKVRQS